MPGEENARNRMECYACDHPLSGQEDCCPDCGVHLVTCANPDCAQLLPVDVGVVCPYCGTDLPETPDRSPDLEPEAPQASSTESTLPEVSENTTPDLTHSETSDLSALDLAASLPPMPDVALDSMSFSVPEILPSSDRQHPVYVEFLQNKSYRIARRTFLEFRLQPVLQATHTIEIRITGSEDLDTSVSFMTPPQGVYLDLDPIPFIPQRSGEELFKIQLTVFLAGGLMQRYRGRAVIEVLDPVQPVHIQAEGDVLIGEMGTGKPGFGIAMPEPECWQPVDLTSTRNRVGTMPWKEPPAGTYPRHNPNFSLDSFYLKDLSSRWRAYVVVGEGLRIGRNPRTEDWTPKLGSGRESDRRLSRISRHHLTLSIRGDSLLLRDHSIKGVELDGVSVPKDFDVNVDDGVELTLAGVLHLHVRVLKQGNTVAAVILRRRPEPSGFVGTLILLNHWVDLAAAGAPVAGWLKRNGKSVCLIADPKRGFDVDQNTEYLDTGKTMDMGGTILQVEESACCGSCGKASVPIPDSRICVFCREPMETQVPVAPD